MENTIEMRQRQGGGKGEARKLRQKKQIPAICYGTHIETPIPVSVDRLKMAAILRAGNTTKLYNVESEDAKMKGQLVLIQDQQIHPLTEELVHVDFLAVDKDEEIKVTVPVVLKGKAKGVAEGGLLQQPNRSIEVRCLPGAIPDKIVVDVTSVAMNEALHVSDITLPEGVTVVGKADRTLAVIVAPDEEKAAPEVAPEVAVVDPKAAKAPEAGKEAKEAKDPKESK